MGATSGRRAEAAPAVKCAGSGSGGGGGGWASSLRALPLARNWRVNYERRPLGRQWSRLNHVLAQ